MNINDKVVLVSGATGGIGGAICEQLYNAGARLLLTGRNSDVLNQLQSRYPGSQIVAADLSQQGDRQLLLEQAKRFSVDIVINAAGVNRLALLTDTSDDELISMVSTNMIAPMLLCRDLIPHLKSRPEPVIVNVGSILGSLGYPGSTAYCASKFGLRGFSEALRRELADTNISVYYFAPRATSTAMNADAMVSMNQALGTAMDSPEWVAEQLLQMLTRGKSSVTYLGWPEKLFVRVNGLLPRLVDNAVIKQLPIIKRFAGQQPN